MVIFALILPIGLFNLSGSPLPLPICSPSKVVPSTTLLEVPLRQPPILLLKRHRNSTSLDACRSDPGFQWLIRSSHPLYATAIFIPYLSVHYAVCALHLSFVLGLIFNPDSSATQP
ncbi:hypothetical protein Bca52824_074139 [Brassica carinata]|uniref:Uncharacterized protein n=1 Tax=Brassica carinata TaxID=52824 RepID=A0A8X7U5K7_BRACI|nr:hypothetical protein Bca52824_074139 [Brassica carinata]